ncbi:MAG: hypothetical protein V5A64_07080 [Candidatus Thermoplasmatota archaeon]
MFNRKGEILLKKTKLTEKQVKALEKKVLGYIHKRLLNMKDKQETKYDPMIT